MTETHILASDAVLPYITAGKALVTVLNTKTGGRFTYRLTAPGKTAAERAAAEILFVSVLIGTDNDNHYKYIGILIRRSGQFRQTAKSKLPKNDQRVMGFSWLVRNVHSLARFEHIEVRYHSRCGKCSKTLTVPNSIDTGLGLFVHDALVLLGELLVLHRK